MNRSGFTNQVAGSITHGKASNAAEAIRALRSIYPSDAQFRSAFSEKVIRTTTSRNRQVVKYVLFEIENRVSNRGYDYSSDKYNIEHILPEHPEDGWSTFTDEQVERSVFGIGNMTIIASAQNRDLGNKPFPEKRAAFEKSESEITQKVAVENEEWAPDRIASRQQGLAAQATGIWRLAELG